MLLVQRHVIVAVMVEVGVDASRIHAHNLHTGSLVGRLEACRIPLLTPLGGAVDGFVGVAACGGGGHDIGDFEVLLAVGLQCFDAPQNHAFEPLKALVHVGGLVVDRLFERRLSRVVNEQVDVADLLDGRDGVLHERLVADVADEGAVFVRAERAGQFLLTGRVEIDAGHEPAFADQLTCQLISQAKRGTGHNRDFLSCRSAHVVSFATLRNRL